MRRPALAVTAAAVLVATVLSPARAATTAHPDIARTDEDVAAAGNVLDNDSADEPLEVASFGHGDRTWAAGATAHVHGGELVIGPHGHWHWRPTHNWHGHVQFTYTTDTGASSTLDITTRPINDGPIAHQDYLRLPGGAQTWVAYSTLLANDTDAEGDPLSIVHIGTPTNCRLTTDWVRGGVWVTPTAGAGTAQFRYTMRDPADHRSLAWVHITVT